jgi:hypothetical protein
MWQPRGRLAAASADAIFGFVWTAATLVASVGMPAALWSGRSVATSETVFALALFALAAWRPIEAVLVGAAVAPVSLLLGTLLGWDANAAARVLPPILCGAAFQYRHTSARLRKVPTAMLCGGLVVASFALASAAVQVGAATLFYESHAELRQALADVLARGTGGGSRLHGVGQAIALAQMALLAVLVASTVDTEVEAARVRLMLTAGAVGAAAFNLIRLAEVALRSGEGLQATWSLVGRLRISAAFPDLNAAGSYFVCLSALSVGALFAAWQRRATAGIVAWAATTGVLVAATAVSGSRVAVAALPLGGAAVAAAFGSRRGWTVPGRAAVVAAALGAALLLGAIVDVRRGGGDSTSATFIRAEFARTTWRMMADHPVFGVGAGQYKAISARYSSTALKQIYPAENAHNNFFQVAGELGPFAVVAFVLLVTTPVIVVFRHVARAGSPMGASLLAGITAFLFTCLAGHPLLIHPVRVCFAVVLGLAAAAPFRLAADEGRRAPTRWLGSVIVACTALALLVTVPPRVEQERRSMPLEHVLLGNARWVRQDGQPQVTFKGHLSMYAPAGGKVVVTIRRAPGQADRRVLVRVSLDGVPADAVALDRSEWVEVPLLVPREGRMDFRRLTFDASWNVEETRRRAPPRVQVQRIRRAT